MPRKEKFAVVVAALKFMGKEREMEKDDGKGGGKRGSVQMRRRRPLLKIAFFPRQRRELGAVFFLLLLFLMPQGFEGTTQKEEGGSLSRLPPSLTQATFDGWRGSKNEEENLAAGIAKKSLLLFSYPTYPPLFCSDFLPKSRLFPIGHNKPTPFISLPLLLPPFSGARGSEKISSLFSFPQEEATPLFPPFPSLPPGRDFIFPLQDISLRCSRRKKKSGRERNYVSEWSRGWFPELNFTRIELLQYFPPSKRGFCFLFSSFFFSRDVWEAVCGAPFLLLLRTLPTLTLGGGGGGKEKQ